MIPLADNYFVYTGKITSPNVHEIECALCGRTATSHYSRSVHAVGWVAFKKGNRVQERYCPTCSRKVWPDAYAKARTIMKQWTALARTAWPDAFAKALAEIGL